MLIILLVFLPFETSAKQQKQIITVGYSPEYNNFISDLNSVSEKGYGYDVFKKIEETSNYQFHFIPINGDLVEAVETQKVDIAGYVNKTNTLETRVLFSEVPHSKNYILLSANDDTILYNDAAALNGKTIATFHDNVAQESLDRYLDFYDVSADVIYGNMVDYLDLDADFYVSLSDRRGTKNNVLNLGVYSYYLISSKQNEDLLQKIDTIFLDIASTEGSLFLELEEAYIAKNVELIHRSLSPGEALQLRQRPLEVGYNPKYAPISFTDENGEPDGIMIDTLNMFAENYGFEINYHPYNLSDDDEKHNQYDILATIYGDPENDLNHFVATEAYYHMPMFAQVQYDSSINNVETSDILQSAKKVGLLRYHSIDYLKIISAIPESELVFYDDWHMLLDDFADLKLDMLLSTESSSSYAELYLKDVERTTIDTDLSIPLQFFISKDISEQYLHIFNVMLDNFGESTYRNIINNQASVFYPEPTFKDHIENNWYYYTVFIVLAVVVSSVVFHYQQKKKRETIDKAYNTDALTGFLAMHKFNEKLEQVIKSAKPGEYEIISFDVDMFKMINTHYSNERGTEVIMAIADGLNQVFNQRDVFITRRTADQFFILRKTLNSKDMKDVYNEDILPRLKLVLGNKSNISMSFGNVIIDNVEENPTTLIGQADSARSHGKGNHSSTFITFDDSMKKLYKNKIDFTFRMEQALKNYEFKVFYQPKINFHSLKIDGAEALVRWFPNEKNPIYPNDFIPVFEENGFIKSLDLFVFKQVCEFISKNSDTINIPRISVNLSAHTLLAENTIDQIVEISKSYDIKHQQLELEITESAMVLNDSPLISRVTALKMLGFLISIDDFGAGVSSLNRLGTMEASILKLDKEFFRSADSSEKSVVIIQDVISMAKHLNMTVVAEGVETIGQALWLKEMDCDYAQGFYFERPMDQDKFKQLLIQDKIYDIET